MSNSSFEDSDGVFQSETWQGQVLADQVDFVFSNEHPEEFMNSQFPEYPTEGEVQESRRDRTITAVWISTLGLAASMVDHYYLIKLIESIKNFHMG
jgi:hypothetical protein